MTETDLDAVMELELDVQHFPWGRSAFKDCLDNNYECLVDDQRGQITGFAVMLISNLMAELLNICVSPLIQRQGIGGRLLRSLLKTCESHGVEEVFLEVRAGNSAAIRFYEAHGFGMVGSRPDYYRSGAEGREAALIYRRLLV